MVDFRYKPKLAKGKDDKALATRFNFLGFTHIWVKIKEGLANSAAIDGKRSLCSCEECDQSAVPRYAALVGQGPTSKALPDAEGALFILWHQW